MTARRRPAGPALVGAAAATLTLALLPAGAPAVPPTGPAENPGDPPASVAVTTPSVPAAGGRVRFTGTGFLNADGKPQRVYVKLDDNGDAGIGPFVADASGALAGSVALSDVQAPADIGDPDADHWLRFLTGPSGRYPDNGPPRSLKAAFRVTAAAVRRVGTSPLRVSGGRVAVRLRAGSADGARGTATLRAAGTTLARGRFALADGKTRSVGLALTTAGRRRLAAGRSATARLTLTPSSGVALAGTVTVKGPAR